MPWSATTSAPSLPSQPYYRIMQKCLNILAMEMQWTIMTWRHEMMLYYLQNWSHISKTWMGMKGHFWIKAKDESLKKAGKWVYLLCRQTAISIDGNTVRKEGKRKMKIKKQKQKQEEGMNSSRSEADRGGISVEHLLMIHTERENINCLSFQKN